MPLGHFVLLIGAVIAAAGVTLALVFQAGVPLAAFGIVTLVACLVPGLRQWR